MAKLASKKLKVQFCATAWTFGFWWDRKKLKAWGIDLGPLAVTYKWKKNNVDLQALRQRQSR